MISPKTLSATAHKITLSYSGTDLSTATGFFYLHNGKPWFVTNWHNVTGRNPLTGQPLSPTGGIPDQLTIKAARYVPLRDGHALGWTESTVSLLDEDGQPKWKVHPSHGEKVDIAAMEFSTLPSGVIAVNDQTRDLSQFSINAGMDAFVLGFPLGISGGASLPVWKRASIASEPSVDIEGLPKILIDTATRSGMSGAPVFARSSSFWAPEGVTDLGRHILGEGDRFVGVYSGRLLGEDVLAAQLGIVWKESALIETIEGARYDEVR